MNILALTALINTITGAVLGTIVLLRNPKNRTHIIFFLFTVSIVFWSISYFFWQISTSSVEALFWIKMLMSGAIFIPFIYFHFITIITNKSRKTFSASVIIGYAMAIVFLILNWTKYFIDGVSVKYGFNYWPSAGLLFTPFLVLWGYYVLYTLERIIQHLKKPISKVEKIQIKYILIGTLFGISGGITNYFLWYDIPIPPYGNITTTIYVLLVGYAILKYGLFNIKVIATEFLIFVLWLFILIRLILAENITEQGINALIFLFSVVAGILLIKSVNKEVLARKELEDITNKLKNANKKLRELDQLKTEFLSIATHQLRTPLTSIKGYISMILEGDYGKAPPRMQRVLKNVFHSSSLMAETITDFMNVSRIELGHIEYSKTNFDCKKLIEEVVDELMPKAKEAGLKLSYKQGTEKKLKFIVNGDYGKLKYVFSNLVENAIKYTPKGSVTLYLKPLKDNKIRIEIEDTGIGISKEELDGLFLKFKRARNAYNVNIKGTGLGLYVAREMLKAHNGKVWVESDGENKGSTFIVELPLVKKE